jgi:hypothetical protein
MLEGLSMEERRDLVRLLQRCTDNLASPHRYGDQAHSEDLKETGT